MTRSWAFTVCCSLSICLVLLPLPWHWRARNTGTLLYIGWTVVGNLVFLVNSIIWNGDFLSDPVPVWCDIVTKLIIGMSVGLTAASLCINRQLYGITRIKSIGIDSEAKRRRIMIDMLLGIGLPILVMALSYIVQGNRYNILEDIGCWPATYPTLAGIPLVIMWPILISVASLIYASLAIWGFLRARRQLVDALHNSPTGINMSRYFRMMGLSAGEIMFSLPCAIYILVLNLQQTQLPWISWADTHHNFSVIQKVPMAFIKADVTQYRVLMLNQWALPAGGFLFFLWFGLGAEAIKEYKRIFFIVVAPLGIKPSPPKPQVIRSQGTWGSRLTSGMSSTGRQNTTVAYPTLTSTTSQTDSRDEKTSTEIAESEYKADHASSPV